MRRILVFQHLPVEHPGVFRDFCARDGVELHVVDFSVGDRIPALDGFDAMWVFGGPMDVWDEPRLGWMSGEKAAIREAVLERRMPYLGICLGHQLLADALGGRVEPMPEPEVGLCEVETTAASHGDALLGAFPGRFGCFQWHSAGVVALPPGTTVLARSPRCGVQAMRVGDHAWGLQYHVEITEATVAEWAAIPEYAASLEKALGAGAMESLDVAVRPLLPGWRADASRIYEGFMAACETT